MDVLERSTKEAESLCFFKVLTMTSEAIFFIFSMVAALMRTDECLLQNFIGDISLQTEELLDLLYY